jgi:hypothetical protein
MELFIKLSKSKKIILWGVGHNHPNAKEIIYRYAPCTKKVSLAGTRDINLMTDFVPCPSCLHPTWDRVHEVKYDLGLVFHKDTTITPEHLELLNSYPSMMNSDPIEVLSKFIGECDSVLTNSYHAMYWSFLLGKKVAVIPNSSKFTSFLRLPYITALSDFKIQDLKNKPTLKPLLNDCRSLNYQFADRVRNFIRN